METSLPFSTLKGKKDFSTMVKISVPFRIFLILEMSPHIIVKLLEPFKALSVTCKLVSLDHADSRFKVYPP